MVKNTVFVLHSICYAGLMNFRITSGQTIGIFSPSSSIVPERFAAGVDILHSRGFKTVIHPQTYIGADSGNQFAGTAQQKHAALMDLWADKNVDLLMASCGGNTASQFLYLLDFDALEHNAKPLLGFSDTTSLLTALYTRAGIGGFFAPTVQTLGRLENQDDVFTLLSGAPDTVINLTQADIIKTGKTDAAPVFAATLSVLMSLAGTPYFPNLAGHILILEDIGEEMSALDRLLWQLYQIVPFPLLAGLVFGDYVDTKDTGRPFGLDFDGIISKYTSHLEIPVLKNAPIGHGTQLFPIPLGRKSILDATNKTLILL